MSRNRKKNRAQRRKKQTARQPKRPDSVSKPSTPKASTPVSKPFPKQVASSSRGRPGAGDGPPAPEGAPWIIRGIAVVIFGFILFQIGEDSNSFTGPGILGMATGLLVWLVFLAFCLRAACNGMKIAEPSTRKALGISVLVCVIQCVVALIGFKAFVGDLSLTSRSVGGFPVPGVLVAIGAAVVASYPAALIYRSSLGDSHSLSRYFQLYGLWLFCQALLGCVVVGVAMAVSFRPF